ncbi:MAG: DUF2179 domain-containing protein [Anaerolineales bacterium]|nr:DUF2179 domain-containing protein [Anaerolineales bacterium]
MDISFDSFLYPQILIPLFICIARVLDVTLGTLRIIFVSRGFARLAPVVGFFEVFIWLLAIGQVMNNLTNIYNYLAYALGFAIGNYIGILIEHKLSLGVVIVQVITQTDATPLIELLHSKGYGITSTKANGSSGPVHIIFSVIKRSNLGEIVEIIKKYNPRAFYTVSDIRAVSEGPYPLRYHPAGKLFSFRKAIQKRK